MVLPVEANRCLGDLWHAPGAQKDWIQSVTYQDLLGLAVHIVTLS